jgi:hypothetical protein
MCRCIQAPTNIVGRLSANVSPGGGWGRCVPSTSLDVSHQKLIYEHPERVLHPRRRPCTPSTTVSRPTNQKSSHHTRVRCG